MNNLILGKHITCFLRNGMVLEGVVEEWSEKCVTLTSMDGKNLLMVHRPYEDILMTKIVLAEEPVISEEEKVVEETEAKQQIRDKLQQALHSTGDAELDKMNIQQLRQLVIEQDKKIIQQKRKEHFGAPGQRVVYSVPKSAYVPAKLPNTPGALMHPTEKK